jgi:hypothetical protein
MPVLAGDVAGRASGVITASNKLPQVAGVEARGDRGGLVGVRQSQSRKNPSKLTP